mgnify:CR=1 FL=1
MDAKMSRITANKKGQSESLALFHVVYAIRGLVNLRNACRYALTIWHSYFDHVDTAREC